MPRKHLYIDIPKTFLPLKLEHLVFSTEDGDVEEIELEYDLRRKGLTLLTYSPIMNGKIELSVINVNGFDFVTHGLDSAVSYDKYKNPTSFNGLYKGQIRTRPNQPFATIKFKDTETN